VAELGDDVSVGSSQRCQALVATYLTVARGPYFPKGVPNLPGKWGPGIPIFTGSPKFYDTVCKSTALSALTYKLVLLGGVNAVALGLRVAFGIVVPSLERSGVPLVGGVPFSLFL